MDILITGAAGNLGSHLARHLIAAIRGAESKHQLRLLIHKHEPPRDITQNSDVTIFQADLAQPATLEAPCAGTDCIVHFAGVLFAPRPEKFLPETNTQYLRNMVDAALAAGVRKFILVSFPHVEGESTPDRPARGVMPSEEPGSAHARTRLAAERQLFQAAAGTTMAPVALRPGMIYSRGVLMIDAARWACRHRLLAVWRRPTWIHLLSLPDFLAATQAAIDKPDAEGVYNLGDDHPLTLQEFLDTAASRWGCRRPWRLPAPLFYTAGALTELFAAIARTRAPLTRDFIRIGMASYFMDTARMKQELLAELEFPTLTEGVTLL